MDNVTHLSVQPWTIFFSRTLFFWYVDIVDFTVMLLKHHVELNTAKRLKCQGKKSLNIIFKGDLAVLGSPMRQGKHIDSSFSAKTPSRSQRYALHQRDDTLTSNIRQ